MCERHGHIATAGAAVDLRAMQPVLPESDGGVIDRGGVKPVREHGFVSRVLSRLSLGSKRDQPEVSTKASVLTPPRVEASSQVVSDNSGVKSILDGIRVRLAGLPQGGGHSKKVARYKALAEGLQEIVDATGIEVPPTANSVLNARFVIAEKVRDVLERDGVDTQQINAYVKMLKGLN
jgi:hypothetical protein